MLVPHFVKLVDTAHAAVREHGCSSLQARLAGNGIASYGGSKARSRGCCAAHIDATGRSMAGCTQKPTLAHSWITHDEDVRIRTTCAAGAGKGTR